MTYMRNFAECLKERLNIERYKQDRSSVYGFTQRFMAYNSNKEVEDLFWRESSATV